MDEDFSLMKIDIKKLLQYLKKYILEYRELYGRFTSRPPEGSGFPELKVSPYLYSEKLACYLCKNGVAVIDNSDAPKEWLDYIKSQNKKAEDLGIAVMNIQGVGFFYSNLNLVEKIEGFIEDRGVKTEIVVSYIDLSLEELLKRLTLGFVPIIDLKLEMQKSDFWIPHILRNLAVINRDLDKSKFISYLEFHIHTDECAWEEKNIWARVISDIRRDYESAFVFAREDYRGGSISLGRKQFSSNLGKLDFLLEIIIKFNKLLKENPKGKESVFHNFLKKHPILLDVYGRPISKPRFNYPSTSVSPISKKHLEPDFIIVYPGQKYKLVELEKPDKTIKTRKGHPTAEFNQAMFQLFEWEHYLKEHYDIVKRIYPGIIHNISYMLVVSRNKSRNLSNRPDEYKNLLKAKLEKNIEIYTYEDLIEKASSAYKQLITF